MVWLLNCTIYGLNEAMADFDNHYSEVSTAEIGMRRLVSDPSTCVWDEGPVIVTKHVDDGMAVGHPGALERFFVELGKHFLLKISPMLTPGSEQMHLGRAIRMMDDGSGYTIKCAPKTVASLF